MKRILAVVILFSFFISFFELSWAKKEKTGKIEEDTLTDEIFGYKFNVLTNWKIKLENEPSLVRSILTKKNYPVNRSFNGTTEDRLIPTIIICADTSSFSLQEIENSLIKNQGNFRNKNDYLKNLEVIATYEFVQSKEIALDSIAGKVYGFKKGYTRQLIDPSARYGPDGSSVVTKEDYLIGEVILLKKGINLYIIQLAGEKDYFELCEKEFSKMLETWKFLK